MAALVGFGAAAINPYMVFESIEDMLDRGVLEGLDRDTALQQALETVVSKGYASRGDMVVLTVGEPMGQAGGTNTLKIVRVGEPY